MTIKDKDGSEKLNNYNKSFYSKEELFKMNIEKDKKIVSFNNYDNLTSVFNKDFFISKLNFEILKNNVKKDKKEEFAIILLSFNEFKEINYTLGHIAADKVVKELSDNIKHVLKEQFKSECTVGRFSNDSFIMWIPKNDEWETGRKLVEMIKQEANISLFVDKKEFLITVSIGVALYPDDGLESDALIRKADIALNKAKEIKINNIIRFDSSLDEEIQEQFWMKNNLSKALENEELFIDYQPIYNSLTKEIVGVEALTRWNHKDKGIILPYKFIPVAEKTGMIYSIGKWVLLKACKQNAIWQEKGYKPIYVSVNISVLDFEQEDFLETIKDILKESNLESKYLQLEITESFFTRNYGSIKNKIKELEKLEIKLAIDDFGTGYSSLGQLYELNIHNLKIDRCFIDKVDENLNKSKIVQTILNLANSLNISVIAEGVERKEELKFLQENNCNIVQGYLFSRPVGIEKIEDLLERWE